MPAQQHPDPNTEFRHWRHDTQLAKEIPHMGLDTCPIKGVKFPVVGTNEENGIVEVLPTKQYIANADIGECYYDGLTARTKQMRQFARLIEY